MVSEETEGLRHHNEGGHSLQVDRVRNEFFFRVAILSFCVVLNG